MKLRNLSIIFATLACLTLASNAFAEEQQSFIRKVRRGGDVSVDQQYIVSFVVGQTRLGLLYVEQTDSGIQTQEASITEIGKTIGSTAVLAQMGWWDYWVTYEVLVIYGDDAGKPLKVGLVEFDGEPKKTANLRILSQIPGQYHPLHLFQVDWHDTDVWRSGSLLTTGTGTSGANNYVSYIFHRNEKTRIFVNPDDRSPGTAAVAPDGGLVSQMTFKGLNHIGVVGKLIDGKLAGSTFQWLKVNAFQGYSQSLSNPIKSSAGTRYLAYRNFRQPGTANSQSKVMIQKVDAKTGQPQGKPRSITNFEKALNVEAEKFQSIAVSPDGGFILYTIWSDACKKQILVARSLGTSTLGKPKIVLGCGQLKSFPLGVYGINITESWPVR